MAEPAWVDLKDGRRARVRPAEPRDAEALIANLSAIGAEGIYLMTERFALTPDEERKILRTYDGLAGLYLVACIGEDLVGGATFLRGAQRKNAHTATVGVALRADARGLGLGAALMRVGIGWARSVGIRKLTLGVFATNERALRLYRTLGFAEEGRLRGQVILEGVPVDELLMALWV
jgi:RimJ/RimL family protein N-acetyltransferase